MQGREILLNVQRENDDTRLQLANCSDTDRLQRKCTEFCTDAGLCANYLNMHLDNPMFYPMRGSNRIGTHHPDPPKDNVKICIPTPLLNLDSRRTGKPCDPPVCAWKKQFSCAYENSDLPPRPNDGSLSYRLCCDH